MHIFTFNIYRATFISEILWNDFRKCVGTHTNRWIDRHASWNSYLAFNTRNYFGNFFRVPITIFCVTFLSYYRRVVLLKWCLFFEKECSTQVILFWPQYYLPLCVPFCCGALLHSIQSRRQISIPSPPCALSETFEKNRQLETFLIIYFISREKLP